MNRPDKAEVREKEARVRAYLRENGYGTMILGRQDNFAWFTDGGNNRVINPSEFGFAILVITLERIFLVSQVMDGNRVMEEELPGLDFEYIPLYWYDPSREEKALALAGGGRVVSDMPLPGADCKLREIYRLHYPLTEGEVAKLRWLGRKTDEILYRTAMEVRPGMTEHEVEAMLLYEYGRENIQCDVLLVGSDERIFRYRHPNPSEKKVGRYLLLHPAVRKWGLHANVTRLMYFGDNVPEEIGKKYRAACRIEAAALSMCTDGRRFCDILGEEKRLYKELGFEEEWRLHYQGGITGYMVADPTLCSDPGNVVQRNQAFDWFITITGVKVEELGINTGSTQEFVSVTGCWPTEKLDCTGKTYDLPGILTR